MGGLATAQWIAILCVVGGSITIALRHIFWNRETTPADEAPEVEVEGVV